jgi:hypothetical protein
MRRDCLLFIVFALVYIFYVIGVLNNVIAFLDSSAYILRKKNT